MDFTNGEYESRVEILLRDINGESLPYDVPLSRIEQDLQKKLGEDYDLAPILSRIEAWVAYILETKGDPPTYPMSRIEKILRNYISGDVEVEPPQSRVEELLLEILDEKSIEELISGTSPIYLPDVGKKGIVSLVQYGKVEQSGTPTPSAPVDIVCNNGAVRMVHRSGLPSGYKLLEYVGGNGAQYVLTDLYLASTDVAECEFKSSTTTGYGAMYGVFKLGESSALYANQTYYGYDADNNKVNTDIRVDTEWHTSRHDFVNGTLTIDDTTVTFTPFEFVNSVKNAVLSRYYNNNYGYNWKGYVRKFKVTRNGEVVCDLLPAKNSDDVAGLYDLVTGNFYTATGGDLLEGNEVDDYELRIVGTPEVLSVASQTASVQNLFAVGEYKDTQEVISGGVTRNVGMKVLDGTEHWVGASGQTFFSLAKSEITPSPITTSSGVVCTHFVSISSYAATVGSAFLSVSYLNVNYNGKSGGSSSSNMADFKAYLAEQYAAGTPVIVLYPLAEEVTETATPQPITVSGDATITANSQHINGIELESKYYKKVES